MKQRKRMIYRICTWVVVLMSLGPQQAFAHGAERGLVMLLPTHYYAFGAMLAVALSFMILNSQQVSNALAKAFTWRRHLCALPQEPPAFFSLLSTILLLSAVLIGYCGPRDPLSNILPLGIWTGWWIGFTLLQIITGNLWPLLNPWSGIAKFINRMSEGRIGTAPIVQLPQRLGYSPALVQFFAFAWFELVSIAPEDPSRLATAVLTYWLFNATCITIFGLNDWLSRGEPFSIIFRLIGSFAPLTLETDKGGTCLSLHVPGASLYKATPLPLSGVCFVLLILGAASFDGLSETFGWMGLWGINPLEYEGRSSTQTLNSVGLILTPLVLATAYFTALTIGLKFVGEQRLLPFAGRIVYSIVPISIAFHSAHYLTQLLINGQYLIKALSDPLGLGWNLLNTADLHVTASMIQSIDSVWMIWTAQVAMISIGHMAGIVLAHLIAMDWFQSHRKAARSQAALAALMVFYTVFGLWLLSTPTIG